MIELKDIIGGVVASMRQTGTNDFVSGTATVSNTFKKDNWVNVDGIDYQVTAADANSFTASGVPNGTHLWIALAPYFYYGTNKEILARLDAKANGTIDKRSQIYEMIALQVPFTIDGFTTLGGAVLSPESGIASANDVSILFIADATRNNTDPYETRIETIIKPQLTPLVKLFKQKLDFFIEVRYATTASITTIPNFGTTSAQGKDKQIAPTPWEVVEGIYNMTLIKCE